jgi:multidrug efflux system membrane fusion protein
MARLHLSTLHDVLTIPAAALQNGTDGSFTFLVKRDGVVEIRKLKLGPVNAETAVVEAGLEDGDLVVTSGQYRLQPGSKVAVEASPPETPFMASKRD